MFVKIINDNIIEAPINYEGYINFNINKELCNQFGYKEFIPAQRIQGHYYNISYEETEDKIIEVLEDTTEIIKRHERELEIQEKVKELRQIQVEYIVKEDNASIKIIEDIIQGLEVEV